MEDVSGSGGAMSVGFNKPRKGAGQEPTLHLYVANCGPAVGLSLSAIEEAFSSFGPVAGIRSAGDSGTRVIVSFRNLEDAVAAKEAWSGRRCELLHGRIMYMQYSVPRPSPCVEDHHPAMTASSQLGIPGLVMYLDFLSDKEEQELLAAVDKLPWQTLAKRRVQHYGYEFLYKSRNVDLSQKLGNLPTFVEQVVEKISSLPELVHAEELSLPLDQLTVNEYPGGVGLSPHIDTHSAFEGSIISLSLAGPCVMEFRRYQSVSDEPGDDSASETADTSCANSTPGTLANRTSLVCKKGMERKALYLPQRSLLVLSDEARYAWHHYIPHHKVDQVIGQTVSRGKRRVSFTFRKVRSGSCLCKFVKDCNSQNSDLSGSPFFPNAEKRECIDSENLGEATCDLLAEAAEGDLLTEECHEDELHNYWEPVDNKGVEQTVSFAHHSNTSRHFCDAFKFPVSKPVLYQAGNGQKESADHVSSRVVSLVTPEIEKLYVHKVYDAIAPHFSATRFAKWPKVAAFLESLAPGSLVADSGCGNGKYLGFNPKCFFVGCDISPPLVAICAERGHEALVADALHLPHRTGFFDAAVSIAVLHHLSNDHRRRRAIEELVRVVCTGGKILITVWAREQEDEALVKKWTPLSGKYFEEWVTDRDSKHDQRHGLSSSLGKIREGDGFCETNCEKEQQLSNGSDTTKQGVHLKSTASVEGQLGSRQDDGNVSEQQQEYFVPWHLPYHRVEINGASAAAVASGFARDDQKKGAVVYDRYYHVFSEGELERLATGIQGAMIVDRFYDKSNWCIILQKSY